MGLGIRCRTPSDSRLRGNDVSGRCGLSTRDGGLLLLSPPRKRGSVGLGIRYRTPSDSRLRGNDDFSAPHTPQAVPVCRRIRHAPRKRGSVFLGLRCRTPSDSRFRGNDGFRLRCRTPSDSRLCGYDVSGRFGNSYAICQGRKPPHPSPSRKRGSVGLGSMEKASPPQRRGSVGFGIRCRTPSYSRFRGNDVLALPRSPGFPLSRE